MSYIEEKEFQESLKNIENDNKWYYNEFFIIIITAIVLYILKGLGLMWIIDMLGSSLP